jgi:hypothetical protein
MNPDKSEASDSTADGGGKSRISLFIAAASLPSLVAGLLLTLGLALDRFKERDDVSALDVLPFGKPQNPQPARLRLS